MGWEDTGEEIGKFLGGERQKGERQKDGGRGGISSTCMWPDPIPLPFYCHYFYCHYYTPRFYARKIAGEGPRRLIGEA